LIRCGPCLSIGDELRAGSRELQSLEFGKAQGKDASRRACALDCAQNAARTEAGRQGKSKPGEAFFIQCGDRRLTRECGRHMVPVEDFLGA
jgi:hypothetical protein